MERIEEMRQKIEEMLKEAQDNTEKSDNYRSLDYWRGTRDGIARITELLNSGEVENKSILDTAEVIHDYMRNGDKSTSREECICWIAQLIKEASHTAPSKGETE